MYFKEKSKEEIEKMTADELAGYYNSFNKHKTDELNKLIEGKATKEDIEALKVELSSQKDKQYESLKKALEIQGILLKKITSEEITEIITLKEQIKKSLNENIETLKKLKAGEKVDFTFNLKGVGTMLESTNLTGQIPQAQRLAGYNEVRLRQPFILDLINRGTTSSNIIEWVEEVTGEGGANYTTEGSKKNQIDGDFKIAHEDVKKITVFVKVSEEMLADIDFMASYINNKLIAQNLNLKVDAEILGGSSGAALNGIITQAQAFAAGAFAGLVALATKRDALVCAIDQIKINNFVPTVIVLHPSDLTAMQLEKNTLGNPLYPELSIPNVAPAVNGVPIVTNTGMTIDHFLVMDATKATAYFKEALNIKTGWESDDFIKNLRTILAEVRLALVIEGNDVNAFVYDDFTTAVAAIHS